MKGWMLDCLHIRKRIGACLGKMKLDGTMQAVDTGSLYRGYQLTARQSAARVHMLVATYVAISCVWALRFLDSLTGKRDQLEKLEVSQMRRRYPNRRAATSYETEERTVSPQHNQITWGKRVYAISFDLDTETLERLYHNTHWRNGYDQIRAVLQRHGFDRQQGSVYFGNDQVDPVRCVLAVQDAARSLPWFRASVSDIRMLRIEENNDLTPALGAPDLFDASPSPQDPLALPAE